MRINKITSHTGLVINVIIETPRASQNKFTYDPELKIFKLKKTLPLGMVFPFDFGFIPNTKGQDGDPLDVLVIMDQPAYPGCLVESRIIAILEAKQKDGKNKEIRNDRIVAISVSSILYADIQHLDELNKSMVSEIEAFFVHYMKAEGKIFSPIGWGQPELALKMIEKSK